MSGLEGRLIQVADEALRRAVALDPTAELKLQALAGKTLRLKLANPALTLTLMAQDGELRLIEHDTTADAQIETEFGALFTLATGQQRIGALTLSGDTQVARAYERVLKTLTPDIEAAFTRVFGDVFGVHLSDAAKAMASYAQRSADTLANTSAHFVRDEAKLLAHRVELERFYDDVDDLRDDVERLAARLEKLERTA